jgi:hypothetical protein
MQIVSNECAYNGTIVSTTVDNGDGTGTYTVFNEDGSVESVENITGLPIFSYPPLDSTGALATLLVVLDVIPIQDAANVIHEEPEHLIAEAEAWSIGAS